MAIALAQEKAATVSGDGEISVTMDSSINEDEFVVVGYAVYAPNSTATVSVTAPAGYSVAKQVPTTRPALGAGMFLAGAWKVAGAGEATTITMDGSGGYYGATYMWVGVYTGMPTGALFDIATSTPDPGTLTSSRSTGTLSGLAEPDNFLVAMWAIGGATTGETYDNGFTEVAQQVDLRIATKVVASTADVACTLSYAESRKAAGLMMAFKSATAGTGPTVTIPTSGIQTTSSATTQIDTITVAAGSSALTEVALACTNGDLTVTLSGSVTVKAGTANTSSTLTLENGASDAEYNTVLATLDYQGDTGFHGDDDITVTAMDGNSATDAQTFYVLNDPYSFAICFTPGTYAQGVAAVESLEANLNVTETAGEITMVATDLNTNVDTDTILLTTVATPTSSEAGHSPMGHAVRTRIFRT